MLFRGRGRLYAATNCKALVQTAGGQKGVTSPSPQPPVSEAGSCKIEEPIGGPSATTTTPEQGAGWSGEIVERVLENRPHEQLLQIPPDLRATGFDLLLGVIDIRPGMQSVTMYDDTIAVPTRGTINRIWNRDIPSKFSLATR